MYEESWNLSSQLHRSDLLQNKEEQDYLQDSTKTMHNIFDDEMISDDMTLSAVLSGPDSSLKELENIVNWLKDNS